MRITLILFSERILFQKVIRQLREEGFEPMPAAPDDAIPSLPNASRSGKPVLCRGFNFRRKDEI